MAATVPSDGICLWPGTDAALTALANWSRLSNYDNRYAQGGTISGFSPTNGDDSSHGHTVSGTHTHIGDPHTHTFFAGDATADTLSLSTASADITIGEGSHSHVGATSASDTLTYGSTAITIDNVSDQDPKFAVLIFMGPSDGLQDIPDNTVCWTDSASLPTGFSKANGTGTTAPDLNGRFAKSAAAGVNGGATGGSDTHTHTSPSHTHSSSTSSHSTVRCGGLGIDTISNDVEEATGQQAAIVLLGDHHDVSLDLATVGGLFSATVTVEGGTESSEPAYIKLLAIENTSGGATTPDGVIIGFKGASVPDNWALCDGTAGTPNCTNLQIKCTTVDGEIADTGGADSHSHNVTDHTHIHPSHTHTATGNDTNDTTAKSGVDVQGIRLTFSHFLFHTWGVFSTTPTLQNATGIVTSIDDGRQPYRTMLFIKKVPLVTSKNFMAGTLWGPTNALAG